MELRWIFEGIQGFFWLVTSQAARNQTRRGRRVPSKKAFKTLAADADAGYGSARPLDGLDWENQFHGESAFRRSIGGCPCRHQPQESGESDGLCLGLERRLALQFAELPYSSWRKNRPNDGARPRTGLTVGQLSDG